MKLIPVIASTLLLLASCAPEAPKSGRLVILHTNDTHSHIDPAQPTNLGGVARRKVLIDSVRAVEPNVLLVDAGDAVQGTLYFHLFKGEVEQKMLNELGYDVQILGNHEFDNGMEALAAMYDSAKPALISTNYDLSESLIGEYFQPYLIKEYEGKKIGIIAINLNPKGLVAEGNYDGVKYQSWRLMANKTVQYLRTEKDCDAIIAVTHIGFTPTGESVDDISDLDLAAGTSGINVIIGGHTHALIQPNFRVPNATGDSVLIVQAGKSGQYLGEVTLDLNTKKTTSRLIRVDNRLDSLRDPELMAKIEPYRAQLDALYAKEVARVDHDNLTNREPALLNFAADFVMNRGKQMAAGVQLAITNKGGLRTTWHRGALTEGSVIDMMPFYNRVVVLELKGADLLEAFGVMASRGGDAVSENVMVTPQGATVDDEPIDPAATYRIATIDYLAHGGDYMTPFTRGTIIAESPNMAYIDLLHFLKQHPIVNPSDAPRFLTQ